MYMTGALWDYKMTLGKVTKGWEASLMGMLAALARLFSERADSARSFGISG